MCGIAGIIGRLDERNRAALERMSHAMVHRGPDASGKWVSAPDSRGWGALLAHRRLSILDLSPAGHQPMSSLCGRFVIVYNGKTILDGHDSKHASGKIGLQWATHAVTGKGIEFRNIKVKRLG